MSTKSKAKMRGFVGEPDAPVPIPAMPPLAWHVNRLQEDEEGQPLMEGLFSNYNDDIVVEADSGTLIGRTDPARGPAQSVGVQLPLHLDHGALSADVYSKAETYSKAEVYTKAEAEARFALLDNMHINGAALVSQERGTTTLTASGLFPADNWLVDFTAGQVSHRSAAAGGPPGISSYIELLCTTAVPSPTGAQYSTLLTYIEGSRIARCRWGTPSAIPITISFWVFSVVTGVWGGSVRNANVTRSYPFLYTINAPFTWEYKTITIPGDTAGVWDTTTGLGACIIFSPMSGSTYSGPPHVWAATNYINAIGAINGMKTVNQYWRITGLSVLPGSVAPDAERSRLIMRPFHEELLLCQRYWETSYPYGTAPGTLAGNVGEIIFYGPTWGNASFYNTISFKTPKRITPTVTLYSPYLSSNPGTIYSHLNAATIAGTADLISPKSFRASGPASGGWSLHYVSSARL